MRKRRTSISWTGCAAGVSQRHDLQLAVGDSVIRGQQIGISGDTGSSTEPHLHFHVQACDGCATVPLTFRNTRFHPRGLVQGESYTAEPF